MLQPHLPQIHQQEGQIVKHVGRGQFLAELQTIERCRLAIHHRDIGQVQVTMAVPRPAPRRTQVEHGGASLRQLHMPLVQRARLLPVDHRRDPQHRIQITLDHAENMIGATAAGDGRIAMESRNPVGQTQQHRLVQRPGLRHMAQ